MSDLQRIVKLAELLVEQTTQVNNLTALLATAKTALLKTEREDLPMLMSEVGLTEVKLEDGRKIAVVEDCSCGMTDATRNEGIGWLIGHGFGGLVKTSVAVTFGRGERETAEEVGKELREKFDDVAVIATVHPSTLKAFVKEQLAAGAEVPMDLFNVYPYSKAVLRT